MGGGRRRRLPEPALCGTLTLGLLGAEWAAGQGLQADPSPPPPSAAESLISPTSGCHSPYFISPACLSLISCLSHLLISSSSPLLSLHPSGSALPDGMASWWCSVVACDLCEGVSFGSTPPGFIWMDTCGGVKCTLKYSRMHVHTPKTPAWNKEAR